MIEFTYYLKIVWGGVIRFRAERGRFEIKIEDNFVFKGVCMREKILFEKGRGFEGIGLFDDDLLIA